GSLQRQVEAELLCLAAVQLVLVGEVVLAQRVQQCDAGGESPQGQQGHKRHDEQRGEHRPDRPASDGALFPCHNTALPARPTLTICMALTPHHWLAGRERAKKRAEDWRGRRARPAIRRWGWRRWRSRSPGSCDATLRWPPAF